ncbi:ParB/RepB/Spo0J family partition protein [Thiohalophilus sp.]|uniref:ParB/RepB/Spo0J family partition protein n=1 Tax=Thiohalophilus sp. TaxID=3028392 RepID=UPI002ACE1A27|nr:ParB/RepB/Spo0J family partition protein [Thiohalophilus sp.]MDZ7804704.1 ParB/RepB/Spo0J family partition protein [Thiohalophilus sp.]
MPELNLQPGELGNIPLKMIDPDPEQPRKTFDEDYLEQLAASIKVDGVIQPVVVRPHPEDEGRFYLVAGENRWRASKLANKRTIPGVLRKVDGLSKLLIQLKENHQRKDLNAIEWAGVLRTMNKVHGLKQADIEKKLKEAGVGQFGRAYISNLIRLLELPEWAQDLIRYGRLTAAHGKYLLPAMASDTVIEELREELTDYEEDAPSTTELQRKVFITFAREHIDLNSYKTDFDYRKKCVATGCQKMRKLSNGYQDTTFCLDQACHAILQAEAVNEQQHECDQRQERGYESDAGEDAGPREITVSDDNRVNVDEHQLEFFRDFRPLVRADFDVRTCDGCKHRHMAVEGDDTEDPDIIDSCFMVSCFLEKENTAKRAGRLLNNWLTHAIGRHVASNPSLIFGLIAWSAAGCPDGVTRDIDDKECIDFGGYLFEPEYDEDVEKVLFKSNLLSLDQFLHAGDEQFAELAKYIVHEMPAHQRVDLAGRFKISIDDYRIDEQYLAEHDEAEIKALFDQEDIKPGTFAELENACNEGALDQFALEHRDLVGVPAAIRFARQKLSKTDSDDDD